MHWKDLRALGEAEQRLYSLDAWRECPYYTARERAALAWTAAVTHVATGHVPDTVLEEARRQLSEKELADLTLVVATINAWNRLSIAARLEPGTYQPAATAH
jgi:alkylhydroperoxidase family enzyme